MDMRYGHLLRVVDRLLERYGRRAFAVGDGGLSFDVAEQLCGYGLIELHAEQAWPRCQDVSFRVVPAMDTEAPYGLVPMLASGARIATHWTATLTTEAEVLAYRKPVRTVARRAQRQMPVTRIYGRWQFEPTLDAGAWAPEQVTVFEELAVVSPSGPRRRMLFGR